MFQNHRVKSRVQCDEANDVVVNVLPSSSLIINLSLCGVVLCSIINNVQKKKEEEEEEGKKKKIIIIHHYIYHHHPL